MNSNPNIMGEMVNAMLFTMSGVWVTMLGYRKIGKRPGESLEYDYWFEKYQGMFKKSGPFMIGFGVFLAIRALISY